MMIGSSSFCGDARRGFTLVELLVAIALVAIVLALAAPSLRSIIEVQRLRSTNAQLVTDLQLARSEAVARRSLVAVSFNSNSTMSCYTIYSTPVMQQPCNCLSGPGSACTSPRVEIRTVQVPKDLGVTVAPITGNLEFAYDPTTGGIMSIPTDTMPESIESFSVEAYLDTLRKFQTIVNRPGRPSVCSPAGTSMKEAPCPG